MKKIARTVQNVSELSEALCGSYDEGVLKNGIRYVLRGSLYHFEGFIDNAPNTIEIPILPVRCAVTIAMPSGWSCVIVVEPNSGIVKVPEELFGKSFCIFATCIVNYQ
ncbi:MAG: hypothetical protein MJZ26_11525 [Fibrobacter sp.]|nr:hypothetical protein [Fibrobacter sp.]